MPSMKMLALSASATALIVSACATKPAPIERPGERSAQHHHSPSSRDLRAPHRGSERPVPGLRVPVEHELRLCSGAPARHTGTIGPNGEVLLFTPAIEVRGHALLRNPTDGGCLTSGFGWRSPVVKGGGSNHRGIDLARPATKRIFAAGDGVVVASGFLGGYGLMVRIDHGNGVETVYAHLDDSVRPARKGTRVRQGDIIGKMGTTGRSTGIHLHYEVIIDGDKHDPLRVGAPRGLDAFLG